MKHFIILSSLFLSLGALAKEVGNGGFLYSRTSLKLLSESQESLLADMNKLLATRKEEIYASQSCPKEINFRELKQMISDLTYSFEAESTAINPDGVMEKRYFHINAAGKVEATELYFSSFVDTYFRYIEAESVLSKETISQPVRMAILHEALHLFGYGEMESRECSGELLGVVENYNDEKRDRLTKEITRINDLAVQKYIEEKCNVTKIVSFYKHLDFDFKELEVRRIYSCVAQWGLKEYDLAWETKPYSNIKAINEITKGMSSVPHLAKKVNEVFRFSFEKPLPAKL